MPLCAYPKPGDRNGAAHPYLVHALNSILSAGHEHVELLVGIDGERPRVREAVENWHARHPSLPLTLHTFPFRTPRRFGNTQRNALMAKATGDYLHFNDHDDRYVDGALGRFAQIAQRHPGRPIVGRMRVWAWNSRQSRLDPPDYLWKTKGLVARGQFGGHMLFVPNRPALLGRWEPESDYCADFQFVKSTIDAFRRARLKEVWVEDFIVECRPWARPA